jgi:hypothetical protein
MDFDLNNLRYRMKLDAVRAEHLPVIERGLPKMTPMEYMKADRIFVGFEVNDGLLPYMAEKYGVECWTYASDIPHAHRKTFSARYILNRPDLSDEVKSRILWEGTARLYGFDAPVVSGVMGKVAATVR